MLSMINNQTTFGIEIETQVPANVQMPIGSHGNGLNIRTAVVNGSTITAPKFNGEMWKADCDPSIRTLNNYVKCEFVSPVLKGDAGLQHILEFLSFLKAIGAKRPIRTMGQTQGGIHVTIHAGSACGSSSPAQILDWCEKLMRLGNRLSPVLFGQNAERRDRSTWCALHQVNYLDQEIKNAKQYGTLNLNIGKYAMINFTKLRSTGCIEFRCFSTTLNPTKIMLIILSVLAICQEATTENLPKWASQNRLRTAQASVMFDKWWRFGGRRHVTQQFATFRRLRRLMFNWGFASCAWFDRIRSVRVADETEETREAVQLMTTPAFQTHTRGSV
jgi:hypothetical protein